MVFSEVSYICREIVAKLVKALCSERKSHLVLQQVVCCYQYDLTLRLLMSYIYIYIYIYM